MGLCKCPKRKTTSHFCFHHCVNVCEHCIVNNHTTCVVKSYTTWLKEASGSISSSTVSASALCAVCQKQFILTAKEIENLTSNFNDSNHYPVTSSSDKTAVRLLCYHIVHARCLSVYVKKQLKDGNILKCPSCDRSLWVQQQEQIQDSNDVTEVESNELSPVALQLFKHLQDHGSWWGQVLIKNENDEDIEKLLLENEDDFQNSIEDEIQTTVNDSSNQEFKPQTNTFTNAVSSLADTQTVHSSNINNSYYNYNNTNEVHTPNTANINHRNNTYQPIHHRNFNNNYGIDHPAFSQQQQQQQQQSSSINMMTIAQSSDLNNRHTTTSSTTPLLLNNDNTSNLDEDQQHPSGKYRPKKFNSQSWTLSYQRLLQYFRGTNKIAEDNNTVRIVTIIICCMLIIVILLVAITSYTRSNNEPFDNNSVDYGGGFYPDNNGGEATIVKNNNNIDNL